MIKSFRGKITEALFNGENPKGFPADLVKVARRKLRYLNAAGDLRDLRSPPGNRLEALAGDRKGQHSIRINLASAVATSMVGSPAAPFAKVDFIATSAGLAPLVATARIMTIAAAPTVTHTCLTVPTATTIAIDEGGPMGDCTRVLGSNSSMPKSRFL